MPARDRGEQGSRAGMLRRFKDLHRRAGLDRYPSVHDAGPVAQVSGHPQVMSHEQIGMVSFSLQSSHQALAK